MLSFTTWNKNDTVIYEPTQSYKYLFNLSLIQLL